MSTKKEETMSTTTDLRQGFVNSMNKKMVAEVHVIRRSADGGEVKEFSSRRSSLRLTTRRFMVASERATTTQAE